MKNLLFLIHLTFINFAFSQTWQQENSGVSGALYKIQFTSLSTGYIKFDYELIKSEDKGATWQTVYTDADGNIGNVYFISDDVGYITVGSKLKKTTDGGTSFTYVADFPGAEWGFGLYFIDENKGFVFCCSGKVYQTTDGGLNWAYWNMNSTQLGGINFITESIGYIGGWYPGSLYKTTDGGSNWIEISNPNILSLSFANENVGYATSIIAGDVVIKTTDGGVNWTIVKTSTEELYSIHSADENNCYVVGNNGFITSTKDGGSNWTDEYPFTTNFYSSVYCTEADSCYAVGANGILIRTTKGNTVSIANSDKDNISVFPNPFNNILNIEGYTTQELKNVTIVNLLGEEVYHQSKFLTNQIDLTFLGRGVYFITFGDGNSEFRKKIIKY